MRRNYVCTWLIVLIAWLVAASVFPRLQASGYTITDLGTLGGSQSLAADVNDDGVVVGSSYLAGDAVAHAFRWTREIGMQDLGTLGGSDSRAIVVNIGGVIAGDSDIAGGSYTHAFRWTAGTGMVDLGTSAGANSFVTAMSSTNIIVGEFGPPGGPSHAFMWTQATGMVDLGTLGGTYSSPRAVNDQGVVVGQSTVTSGEIHAFLWTQNTGMVNLGTLGGVQSAAVAVNNNGRFAGFSYLANGSYHAVTGTQTTELMDLGTLGGDLSVARLVNDSGMIAGWSSTVDSQHAFVWAEVSGMTDIDAMGPLFLDVDGLNANGAVISTVAIGTVFNEAYVWSPSAGKVSLGTLAYHSRAVAISDSGLVAGYSMGADLQYHAVLWTPPTTVYTFSGFFAPVDNQPTFNLLKAGAAVRLKFSLGGNYGLNVFDPGYPASQATPCSSSSAVDPIEETVTAGSSSLRYEAGSKQYVYVWKTDKAWANTCRQLILKFNDGAVHSANFTFSK